MKIYNQDHFFSWEPTKNHLKSRNWVIHPSMSKILDHRWLHWRLKRHQGSGQNYKEVIYFTSWFICAFYAFALLIHQTWFYRPIRAWLYYQIILSDFIDRLTLIFTPLHICSIIYFSLNPIPFWDCFQNLPFPIPRPFPMSLLGDCMSMGGMSSSPIKIIYWQCYTPNSITLSFHKIE